MTAGGPDGDGAGSPYPKGGSKPAPATAKPLAVVAAFRVCRALVRRTLDAARALKSLRSRVDGGIK